VRCETEHERREPQRCRIREPACPLGRERGEPAPVARVDRLLLRRSRRLRSGWGKPAWPSAPH